MKKVTSTNQSTEKKTENSASQIPQKNTMNLVHHQANFDFKKFVPAFILLGIVVLIFLKFGIFDPLAGKISLLSRISAEHDKVAAMSEELKAYDELANDYGKYSNGWMNESEVSTVDRLDVIALIEEKVANVAVIENYAINGNILSLNIRDVTLTEASAIVVALEESELVKSASLGRATAETGREAIIFMTVTLTKGGE